MKPIGTITVAERDEIRLIFNRKTSLLEIATTLAQRQVPQQNEMYQRVVDDLTGVNTAMGNWWQQVLQNHQWVVPERYNWHVNFETCEVSIVEAAQ